MNRLDKEMVARGMAPTRSQAENYIKLGKVKLDGRTVNKAGVLVKPGQNIELALDVKYVSRAGLKLASVAGKLSLDFKGKTVLDVGSSTGGFTDYALRHGAKKVIAIDVGSQQLHPSLRENKRVELHEKTDIRSLRLQNEEGRMQNEAKTPHSPLVILRSPPDIALVDVSFISLREVLPAVAKLSGPGTQIAAMLKPQFEAGEKDANKGVIKNDTIRRRITREFEVWAKQHFLIVAKADSEVAGSKGNRERFYLLKVLPKQF